MKIIFYFIILIIYTTTLKSQTLNWAYLFGGPNSEVITDIAKDKSGNIFAVGNFNSEIDLSSAGQNIILNDPSGADGFLAKFDSEGNILWAFNFNSSFNTIYKISIDNQNNIYLLMVTLGTVDLDPSSNTVSLSNTTIVANDNNGNYLTHYNLNHAIGDIYYDMTISNNFIYVVSKFNGSFDIDPGPGVYPITGYNGIDIVIAKFTLDLNLELAFSIGGVANDYGTSIFVDNRDNMYVAGRFQNDIELNPNGTSLILNATDSYDAFFAKYNPNGELIFAKQISGNGDEYIKDMFVNKNILYLVADFTTQVITNPDTETNIFTTTGNSEIFIGKYSANNGAFIDSRHLQNSTSGNCFATNIIIDPWDNVIITVTLTGVNNIALDGGINNKDFGFQDIVILKYNPTFGLMYDFHLEGGEIDNLSAVFFDEFYNFIVGGSVRVNSIELNPNGTSFQLTPAGNSDMLLASYRQIVPPRMSLMTPDSIQFYAARFKSKIIYDGNDDIIRKGIVISERPFPTIDDYDFIIEFNDFSNDSINFFIRNLFSGTKYYIRTYAENSEYLGYSNQQVFETVPTMEDLAPNNGDGNFDGIRDSRQDEVLSIRGLNNQFITIIDKNKNGIYDEFVAASSDRSLDYFFPYGEFSFKINAPETQIKIYFHDIPDFTKYKYRKKTLSGRFVNMEYLEEGREFKNGKYISFVVLNLKDGDPFDMDGGVNGIIFDPGGPAIITENIPFWDWWYSFLLIPILIYGYKKYNV